MGSVVGGQKSAAKKIGMPYEEYVALLESGKRRCWMCRTWRDVDQFYRRNGYSPRVSGHCIGCARKYMRAYMRTYRPKAQP